jgi:biopolymer transport protein ExbD
MAHGLIITSMVDMFTLVLLFLLMFYDPMYDGSSPLELPTATVQKRAEAGPTVRITTTGVQVDGKPVVALVAGRLETGGQQEGRAIRPLVEALSSFPAATADSAIGIECDKRVSWEVLGAVLESAAQAGFPRYRFIVAGQ